MEVVAQSVSADAADDDPAAQPVNQREASERLCDQALAGGRAELVASGNVGEGGTWPPTLDVDRFG